jgi:hypothetical protein
MNKVLRLLLLFWLLCMVPFAGLAILEVASPRPDQSLNGEMVMLSGGMIGSILLSSWLYSLSPHRPITSDRLGENWR